MPSTSHIVRHLINAKPLVYEGLIEGVISHAGLAEYLQKDIELELGKEVNLPAIVMAIRRYAETLEKHNHMDKKEFKLNSEVIMKTGLAEITIAKSPKSMERIKGVYNLINQDRGDTLNIIQGNYEVTIVITQKYLDKLKKFLKGEKLLNTEKDLVSLSVSFSSDFLHTPGILAKVTRILAWEDVNIIENISTMTELIFIIQSKNAVKGYKALQRLAE